MSEALIERVRHLEAELLRSIQLKNRILAQLHETCTTSFDLGRALYALVDAFDANDRNAIAAQLRQMSDRRKQFTRKEYAEGRPAAKPPPSRSTKPEVH